MSQFNCDTCLLGSYTIDINCASCPYFMITKDEQHCQNYRPIPEEKENRKDE